jgi:hypothetical protein
MACPVGEASLLPVDTVNFVETLKTQHNRQSTAIVDGIQCVAAGVRCSRSYVGALEAVSMLERYDGRARVLLIAALIPAFLGGRVSFA